MIAPLYLKLTWHLKSWTNVLRHFHICGIFFSIAYVRYIKIVTWLRGFRYKTANFYHSVVSQFLEETWAQRKLNQISKMTRQPWSHVRILINQQGCALRKIDGSPVPWTCKGQKLGSRGHRALLERSPVWTWAFYTCPSLPHPTNNIGRVYPELFSEYVGRGERELQENIEKNALFYDGTQKLLQIMNIALLSQGLLSRIEVALISMR